MITVINVKDSDHTSIVSYILIDQWDIVIVFDYYQGCDFIALKNPQIMR